MKIYTQICVFCVVCYIHTINNRVWDPSVCYYILDYTCVFSYSHVSSLNIFDKDGLRSMLTALCECDRLLAYARSQSKIIQKKNQNTYAFPLAICLYTHIVVPLPINTHPKNLCQFLKNCKAVTYFIKFRRTYFKMSK